MANRAWSEQGTSRVRGCTVPFSQRPEATTRCEGYASAR